MLGRGVNILILFFINFLFQNNSIDCIRSDARSDHIFKKINSLFCCMRSLHGLARSFQLTTRLHLSIYSSLKNQPNFTSKNTNALTGKENQI